MKNYQGRLGSKRIAREDLEDGRVETPREAGHRGLKTLFRTLTRLLTSWWGDERKERRVWRRSVAAVVAIGLPTAFLSLSFLPSAGLREGDVSDRDIRSPRTVRFVDAAETGLLRQEAANNVPPQYAPDEGALSSAIAKVEGTLGTAAGIGKESSPLSPGARLAVLRERLALELSAGALATVASAESLVLEGLEQDAVGVVRQVMERPIRQGIPRDLRDAEEYAEELVAQLPLRQALRGVMVEVCQKATGANRHFDPEVTRRATDKAVEAVQPVYSTLRAGEVIVRAREKVSGEQLAQLEAAGLRSAHADLGTILLTLCATSFLVGMVGVFAKRYSPAAYDNDGFLLVGGGLLAVVILVFKLFSTAAHPWLIGMMAVATVTMVVSVLSDVVVGVVMTCSTAVLLSMAASNETGMVPVLVSCGLVSALSVEQGRRRLTALVRSGVTVGLANALLMLVGGAIVGITYEWEIGVARRALFAFFSGPVAAMTAFGIILALEKPLGITTTFRLVELSNPHERLLKELMTKAPGTYHSSLMVANLASAAAEASGADALLAQVGAYYHDIGKVRRPGFFVENQFFGRNPHDRLLPSLSALVLASHVKEGAEMAKAHRLPQPIIDIIWEHHGTSVMSYFHEKALRNPNGGEVQEGEYRYPGPRPRSKEAAIVMLADTVEAAVRSLADPSPSQIRDLVRALIKERVSNGQLDESGLTFREVAKVQESLANNLVGVFHARIEYPEIDELAATKQEPRNNNRKQAEEKGTSPSGEEVRPARPGFGGGSA